MPASPLSPRRLAGIAVWCALCASVVALLGGTSARADTISFTCPGAPAGWQPAAGGAVFWGPEQNPGTDLERITCSYLNGKHEGLGIVVNYALPTDPNPIDDFPYGCNGLGSVAWTDAQRVYQLASGTHWLTANFTDPYDLLSGGGVAQFEGVAHQMLNDAEGLAHACKVAFVPTSTLAHWLFDFDLDLGGGGVSALGAIGTHIPPQSTANGVPAYPVPDGSFETKGPARNPTVAHVSAPTVAIRVVAHGARHTVTIALTNATRFRFRTLANGGQATASLLLGVTVVDSSLPSCRVGSKGTLLIATVPATVRLDLCGPLFGTLTSRSAAVTIQQA
jgi:hypothetical protein